MEKLSAELYFIQSESGMLKVGISTDVENRLKCLQTASFEKLWLRFTIRGGNISALESCLHSILSKWHRSGEWFLPPEGVVKWIHSVLYRIRNNEDMFRAFLFQATFDCVHAAAVCYSDEEGGAWLVHPSKYYLLKGYKKRHGKTGRQ